jgi:hypothetical protein
MARIEAAELRMAEIDEMFCAPNYYEQTPAAEVRELETERAELEREVGEFTAEWERTEEEMDVVEEKVS